MLPWGLGFKTRYRVSVYLLVPKLFNVFIHHDIFVDCAKSQKRLHSGLVLQSLKLKIVKSNKF